MIYIIGNKNDLKIKEKAEITSTMDKNKYKDALSKNYGGTSDDYSILEISGTDSRALRIAAGDEYTPVWNNGVLTDISFSDWDNKKIIKTTCNKTEILSNGNDSCVITFTLYEKNGITKDEANLNGVYIEVRSPNDFVKLKLDFSKGKAEATFKTTTPGEWLFPSNNIKLINDYRVESSVLVEALLA